MDSDSELTGGRLKLKNKTMVLHLKNTHHKKLLAQEPFNLAHADLLNTDNSNKIELNVHPKFHTRYRKALRQKKGLKFLKSDFHGGQISLNDIGSNIIKAAKTTKQVIKKYVPKDVATGALTAGLTALSPETAPVNAVASKIATNLLYGGEIKEASKGIPVKYKHMPNGTLLKGIPVNVGGLNAYDLPLSTDVHTFATRKRLKQ